MIVPPIRAPGIYLGLDNQLNSFQGTQVVHLAANGASYSINPFSLHTIDRVRNTVPLTINKILIFIFAIT